MGTICRHTSREKWGLIRRTSAASIQAFSLPCRARRSKEAACAVQAVDLRIPRARSSAVGAVSRSLISVRVVGWRIRHSLSSVASVEPCYKRRDGLLQLSVAAVKARPAQGRQLVLRYLPQPLSLTLLHPKPNAGS